MQRHLIKRVPEDFMQAVIEELVIEVAAVNQIIVFFLTFGIISCDKKLFSASVCFRCFYFNDNTYSFDPNTTICAGSKVYLVRR